MGQSLISYSRTLESTCVIANILNLIFLVGLEEDETKLVLHLSLNPQLDAVRWNPLNQDEVSTQLKFLLTQN